MWKIRRIWWFSPIFTHLKDTDLRWSQISQLSISFCFTFLFCWTLWPLGATWQEIFQVQTSKGRKTRNYIVIWMCVYQYYLCIYIIYVSILFIIYLLSFSSLNLSELKSLCRVSLSSLRRNDKWRKSEHLIHEANWIWRLIYKAVSWILGAYHRSQEVLGLHPTKKRSELFHTAPNFERIFRFWGNFLLISSKRKHLRLRCQVAWGEIRDSPGTAERCWSTTACGGLWHLVTTPLVEHGWLNRQKYEFTEGVCKSSESVSYLC